MRIEAKLLTGASQLTKLKDAMAEVEATFPDVKASADAVGEGLEVSMEADDEKHMIFAVEALGPTFERINSKVEFISVSPGVPKGLRGRLASITPAMHMMAD